MRTERGVLPVGHPRRAEAVLAGMVAAVERGDEASAAAGLEGFMDEEALHLAEVQAFNTSVQCSVQRAVCQK